MKKNIKDNRANGLAMRIGGWIILVLTIFTAISAAKETGSVTVTALTAIFGGLSASVAFIKPLSQKTKAWIADIFMLAMISVYIFSCKSENAAVLLIGDIAVSAGLGVIPVCLTNIGAAFVIFLANAAMEGTLDSSQLLTVVYLVMISVTFAFIAVFRKRADRRAAEKTQSHEDLLQLLELKKNEAEKAAKAKGEFIAGLSYEIRLPLNTICGMNDLLRHNKLNDECMEYTENIKESAEQLLTIIDDVLDFSRVEAGGDEVVCQTYSVRKFVEETISEISASFKNKDIAFIVNVSPDIPASLSGDLHKLEKIVSNILSNAVKYTNHGMVTMTVGSEHVSADKVLLTVSVEDTGIGIKADDIPKLFTEFFRVDNIPGQSGEGAGLGLAIARRLAVLMGGDITVESVYGVGSTFTASVVQQVVSEEIISDIGSLPACRVYIIEPNFVCRLSACNMFESLNMEYFVLDDISSVDKIVEDVPENILLFDCKYARSAGISELPSFKKAKIVQMLSIQDHSDIAFAGVERIRKPLTLFSFCDIVNGLSETVQEKNALINSFTAPEARVLIVDDTASNRKVVEAILKCYGIRSVSAESGEKALRLMRAGQQFDLIFMDQLMPDMSGTETVKHIRALRSSSAKQVPIIALTATTEKGASDELIASGMNDYIAKPIDMALFDKVMCKWIPVEKQISNGVKVERS